MILARLWTYQAERFPLLKHGLLIAVFAGSATALARLLGGEGGWLRFAGAFVVLLILFFHLRVADEHKDYAEDCEFRPERPVARGLISLQELRVAAILSGVVAVVLTWAVDRTALIYLLAAWTWLGLMTAEFFAPTWLKARPAAYLFSHMAVMPLLALLALGLAGLERPLTQTAAWGFLALTFLNGLALEIGRKAWTPEHEREGVETYSKLWGPVGAAWAAGGSVVGAMAAGTWVLIGAGASLLWCVLSAFVGLWCLYRLRAYARGAERAVETPIGVFALTSYLSVSILPLAARL